MRVLSNIIKNLFSNAGGVSAPEPRSSIGVPLGEPRPAPQPVSWDGKTIVTFLSNSRSEGLAGGLLALGNVCRDAGYEFIAIDLRKPGWDRQIEDCVRRKREICCVYTASALGDALQTDTPQGSRPLWSHTGIPFISGFGDHPAYFWDAHQSRGTGFASLYSFQEHLDAVRDWLDPLPVATLMPVFVRDPVPPASIDFGAKRAGAICFFKNGNSPKALLQFWRSLPAPVSGWLAELAHGIDLFRVGRGLEPLHRLVRRYLIDRGQCAGPVSGIEVFMVAQLDDYARRVKSTMMAEALLDFPVRIFGDNWGHVDFTGRRAEHLEGRSYFDTAVLIGAALCVMDMSPNTESAPHERFTVATGRHTLCLSNAQQYYEQNYPDAADMLFDFNPESLRQRIADVLARPGHYVDLGVAVAERASALHPASGAVAALQQQASLARFTAATEPFPGQQNFVVWPPQRR